jgi:hypothetical protein
MSVATPKYFLPRALNFASILGGVAALFSDSPKTDEAAKNNKAVMTDCMLIERLMFKLDLCSKESGE